MFVKMNDRDKTKKLRAMARSLTTKLISKIEVTLNEEVEETIVSSLRVLLGQLSIKCELRKKNDIQVERFFVNEMSWKMMLLWFKNTKVK